MKTIHSAPFTSPFSACFRLSSILLTYMIAKWHNMSFFHVQVIMCQNVAQSMNILFTPNGME